MTEEEVMAAAQILCRAYYIGQGYSTDTTEREATSIDRLSHFWAKTVIALDEMGYAIRGGISAPVGKQISPEAFMKRAEQLAEDARVTLEAQEKAPEPNKKAISQWRYALNCLVGAVHKRGLLPDLKEAGPGAY